MNKIRGKQLVTALLAMVCATAAFGGTAIADKVTANAATQSLYSQDFESLSTSATAGDIYGASALGGGIGETERYIVEGSTPSHIDARCTFNEWGYGECYLDTGRANMGTTDVSKTYTFTAKVKPYGALEAATLMIQSADTAKYDSVIILPPAANKEAVNDGAAAYNYKSEAYVTLLSASCDDNGWWTLEFTAQGTGSYIFNKWSMKTSNATPAEETNSGICIAEWNISDGTNTLYELKAVSGLVGNDAIFGATGWAGLTANAKTVGPTGIDADGKSVKVIYDFWPTADGGWQKSLAYFNENNMGVVMNDGEDYIVEFEVAPFGRVGTTITMLQYINDSGVAAKEEQIQFNSNASFQINDYGNNNIIDDANTSVIFENGVWKVRAKLHGAGYKLKLSWNMCSSDADGANTAKDTGIYLDNVKVFKCIDNDSLNVNGNTFKYMGASIRMAKAVSDDKGDGIRFLMAIEKNVYENLVSLGAKFGTLLIPENKLAAETSLTVDTALAANVATDGKWTEKEIDGTTYMVSLVYLWGIPEANYATGIYARGYVQVGDTYFYTTESEARSIQYVAQAAVNDPALTPEEKAELENNLAAYLPSEA